jgi:Predicted dehydrogenases and related proteins
MKKIGFIGAQSLHSVYFGEVLSSGVPGLASNSGRIWAPDTPDLVPMRLVQGEISESCATLDELLEKSDAIMILLRDGNTHRSLAEQCLKTGKPLFVDKPFACAPEDARAMLDCAQKHNAPLMGGSTLCLLPETKLVASLATQANEITISFAANWSSPFGGWCYYGSHLTDLCIAVAGGDIKTVSATRLGEKIEALVSYENLKIRLCSEPDIKNLSFSISLKSGETRDIVIPDYDRCYRLGMESFSRMLKSGKSVHPERLYHSTVLLHQIVKTLSDGKAHPSGF